MENNQQNFNYHLRSFLKYKRVFAYVIDVLVTGAIAFSITAIITFIFFDPDYQVYPLFSFCQGIILIFRDILGVGKKCMNISVVTVNHGIAKWYQKIIRHVFLGPLFLVEVVLFISDRPRVGDLLAKTAVVLKE